MPLPAREIGDDLVVVGPVSPHQEDAVLVLAAGRGSLIGEPALGRGDRRRTTLVERLGEVACFVAAAPVAEHPAASASSSMSARRLTMVPP